MFQITSIVLPLTLHMVRTRMPENDLIVKYEKYFQITRITFATIGIDPMGVNENIIIVRPLISYGHYLITFLFALAATHFSWRHINNVNEFTLSLALLNQLIIALWKIFILFLKRQRIQNILKSLRLCMVEATGDELKIVDKFYEKNLFVSRLYCIAVAIAGVNGLLRPIVMKLLNMIQGLNFPLEVPHKASFFWTTSTPMGYISAYICNVIVIYFLFNSSVAIETLFLWVVTNIVIQFRILQKRFEMAAHEGNSNTARLLIIKNIRFHNRILDLIKEFDAIFGEIIFVMSLVSCTQICFLVYRLMNGKDTNIAELNYSFTFLAAVAVQLIIYCFGGQLIKDESLEISLKVYEFFDWSQLRIDLQKILQLIMLRSQKNAYLRGVFFYLDLSLYAWFYKTAGCLIAVLQTLENKF